MAVKDKKTYNKESYIKKLAEAKAIYEERKNYLKEFSLKKSSKNNGETNEASESLEDFGSSNYIANGKSASELQKMSLKGSSGLTAEELNSWINPRTKNKKCRKCGKVSHMYNSGEWFIAAEKASGYRADAMVAHAAEESGWGTSRICCDKKNFNGYGAVDSNPYGGAYSFETHRDGVISVAKLIGKGYIYRSRHHKGAKDQDSFWLMNNPPPSNKGHRYASNNAWVSNICAIWAGSPKPSNNSNSSNNDAKVASVMVFNDNEVTDEKEYTIINPLPTGEELDSLIQMQYSYQVPIGKVKGMSFYGPRYIRERYVADRKSSRSFIEKIDYSPLPSNEFYHLAGAHENYYSKEARQAFLILKNKLGYSKLLVTRGYDPRIENTSSHSIGIAMDIFVSNPVEAITIADTAWLMGIRAIAIGPNFVHVDVGPEATWGYENLSVYQGPGTMRVGELQNGFR
ncbi:glucosaminidase domain-containing protein [Cytobacillus horneckiae]|uniref:glucosaminidase domain-containing protein n=1 Tax=Cytobacillus horneckiae TaxID=549687 RepID=UPI0034CF1A81